MIRLRRGTHLGYQIPQHGSYRSLLDISGSEAKRRQQRSKI